MPRLGLGVMQNFILQNFYVVKIGGGLQTPISADAGRLNTKGFQQLGWVCSEPRVGGPAGTERTGGTVHWRSSPEAGLKCCSLSPSKPLQFGKLPLQESRGPSPWWESGKASVRWILSLWKKQESGSVIAAGRAQGLSMKRTRNITPHGGQRQALPEPWKDTPGTEFFTKSFVKAHCFCHAYKKLPDYLLFRVSSSSVMWSDEWEEEMGVRCLKRNIVCLPWVRKHIGGGGGGVLVCLVLTSTADPSPPDPRVSPLSRIRGCPRFLQQEGTYQQWRVQAHS